jgi:hypothetical protein
MKKVPTMTKTNMISVVTDSYFNQTADTLIITYRVTVMEYCLISRPFC